MLIEKLFEFSKTYKHPRLLQHVRRSPQPLTFNFLVDWGNIQPKASAELLSLPTASWTCLYHIFELVVKYTHVFVYFMYFSRLIKLSLYQYRVMIQFLFGIGVLDPLRMIFPLSNYSLWLRACWYIPAIDWLNTISEGEKHILWILHSTVHWKRTGTCTVLHWLTSHNTRRCTCLHVDAWQSTLDKWSNTNY